jgi:hypothetical protein
MLLVPGLMLAPSSSRGVGIRGGAADKGTRARDRRYRAKGLIRGKMTRIFD